MTNSRIQIRSSLREFEIWNLKFAISSLFLARARPKLDWQVIPARRIARLAARNQVPFGRPAATNHRHEMIHCKFRRRELAAAMVTNTARALALPPLAPAQLARLLPLAAYLRLGDFDQKWSRFHHHLTGKKLVSMTRRGSSSFSLLPLRLRMIVCTPPKVGTGSSRIRLRRFS